MPTWLKAKWAHGRDNTHLQVQQASLKDMMINSLLSSSIEIKIRHAVI